jgi:hypothetical protein
MIKAVLIRIGLAAIVFGAGLYFGYTYERNDCQAEQAEAQVEAVEIHDQAAEAGQEVERQAVRRRVKTDAVFNGIQQGVISYAQTHPVATDCRLDADGLRLWAAANAGADPESACRSDDLVRALAAAGERCDDGSADQSHRRGSGLSPVPGSAPGADRLAGGNQ